MIKRVRLSQKEENMPTPTKEKILEFLEEKKGERGKGEALTSEIAEHFKISSIDAIVIMGSLFPETNEVNYEFTTSKLGIQEKWFLAQP